MPLFKVTLNSKSYDPYTWSDCYVLGVGDRQLGHDVVFIQANLARVNSLPHVPAIAKVEPVTEATCVTRDGVTLFISQGNITARRL